MTYATFQSLFDLSISNRNISHIWQNKRSRLRQPKPWPPLDVGLLLFYLSVRVCKSQSTLDPTTCFTLFGNVLPWRTCSKSKERSYQLLNILSIPMHHTLTHTHTQKKKDTKWTVFNKHFTATAVLGSRSDEWAIPLQDLYEINIITSGNMPF